MSQWSPSINVNGVRLVALVAGPPFAPISDRQRIKDVIAYDSGANDVVTAERIEAELREKYLGISYGLFKQAIALT